MKLERIEKRPRPTEVEYHILTDTGEYLGMKLPNDDLRVRCEPNGDSIHIRMADIDKWIAFLPKLKALLEGNENER